MSVQLDYVDLKSLQHHKGYQLLENEWLYQVSKVEASRSKAAKGTSENNWKFWAGYEEGFKLAVTTLERALKRMEEENAEEKKDEVNQLLEEIRPK